MIDYNKNDVIIKVNGDCIELYKCIKFNDKQDIVLLFRVDLTKNTKEN